MRNKQAFEAKVNANIYCCEGVAKFLIKPFYPFLSEIVIYGVIFCKHVMLESKLQDEGKYQLLPGIFHFPNVVREHQDEINLFYI